MFKKKPARESEFLDLAEFVKRPADDGREERIRIRLIPGRKVLICTYVVPGGDHGQWMANRQRISMPIDAVPRLIAALQASIKSPVLNAAQRGPILVSQAMPSHTQSDRTAARQDHETNRNAVQRCAARDLHAAGVKPDEIAMRLGVSRATVYRWLKDAPSSESPVVGAQAAKQPVD
jgi:hypothetical protein